MSYKSCENCGSRVYKNGCVNCNEAHYIAEQYEDLGMPVPETIEQEMRDRPLASERGAKE